GYLVMRDSCMEILQAAHGLLGTELQRLTDRLSTGQRGGTADLVLQSVTTNRVGVSDRLTTLGSIDDQCELVILDHVDHMRTALRNLVDPTHRQTGIPDQLGSAGGSDDCKAELDQITSYSGNMRLVIVALTNECTTTVRQNFARAQLSLGEGFSEAVTNSHYLTSGFHFRAENWIDTRELGKREYRFLDAVEVRDDF